MFYAFYRISWLPESCLAFGTSPPQVLHKTEVAKLTLRERRGTPQLQREPRKRRHGTSRVILLVYRVLLGAQSSRLAPKSRPPDFCFWQTFVIQIFNSLSPRSHISRPATVPFALFHHRPPLPCVRSERNIRGAVETLCFLIFLACAKSQNEQYDGRCSADRCWKDVCGRLRRSC